MRILALLILSGSLTFMQAQSWTGVIAPARATDWSSAGLPAIFPDGETTVNPWTPPTRTQCVTSACNTVSGGSVTASTVNAAILSAPAGTFVLIPAGTFALGGSINITTSNVTLRGAGAASTKLTGGGVNIGNGRNWGGASFLSSNPTKGGTTIQVSAPPSAGRLAMMEQCDDGFSSTNAAGMTHFTGPGYANPCTGSYSDPSGPWVCGLNSICDRNGGGTPNPHFQTQVFWINTVVGSTVTIASPLANANWSTARSAVLTWLSGNGVVGSGIEGFTLEGDLDLTGTYACWAKGTRLITTSATAHQISFSFDSHALIMNNYIGATQGGSGASRLFYGSDSGEQGHSDPLILNNIIDGGYMEGNGGQTNMVEAYNYVFTSGNTSFVENGDFMHHAGTSFLLREGNQMGYSLDDDTWGTHNFNSWFRNYITCKDFAFPSTTNAGFQIGSWARFENVVGNVLGGGPSCTTYSNTFQTNTKGTDSLTVPSLMNWGNYVLCSGDARCNTSSFLSADVPSNLASFGANSTPYQNSVPASNALPASFFMNSMTAHANGGTGLSWWKTCSSWTTFPTVCASTTTPPMPPIGPEVTGGNITGTGGHSNNIPAAIAFNGLPADNNYTTAWGHLKQFDERVFLTDPSGNSSGINLSPALGFGTQKIGTTSSNQNLIVTSNGTLALTISSVVKGGTNSVDFSMSHDCPLAPSTLAPSSTCQINVTFTPSATGSRTATVTVTSDAPTSPNTANLSGTGTAPAVSFSPTTVGFGSVTAGTNSAGMGTQLSNTGDAVLAISSISITGTDSSQFSILSNTCGATLAPSTSCTITARFNPSISGVKSASISVVDDATGSPHSVPLSGTGTPNPSPTTTITTGGGITVTGGITIK